MTIQGRAQLVYEIHLTNFLPNDVLIRRLRVLDRTRALADYGGTELTRRIGRPGLRRPERPESVAPGMRAVLYLWIDLAGTAVPSSVNARVDLDVLRPTGPVSLTVDGAPTAIPLTAPVVLAPPLRGGPWTAMYDPLLDGGHRTAIYTVDGRARIPARFAVDWVGLTPAGTMEGDAAPHSADWNGRGADVLAVADATVSAAVDDLPDSPDVPATPATPMPLENASGNYVTLDLGNGRFAFYEHLQHGSVAVKVGDRVRVGQVIGRLGNSGSSSMGPHLHFHVSNANSPLGAEGLPFVLARFEHLGAFESLEAVIRGLPWVPEIMKGVRTREHPSANSVIRFPD